MTLGILGTGPYGRIRVLRREMQDHKYELETFVSRSPRSKKRRRLEGRIADCQSEIRDILRKEKERKGLNVIH